jgi:putative AdoMet-dependent methyltransferase
MPDLFESRAADWDSQPVPIQISAGVTDAMLRLVPLTSTTRVMDFGAGTGLICGKLAPHVASVLAVDVSRAMLDQLAAKPDLAGKVATHCGDILVAPLDQRFDLVVSAMAMHHVQDTAALLRTLHDHLAPGGSVALADLDTEDGTFHPPGAEGVFHAGFDRAALGALLVAAGFAEPAFHDATVVHRDGKPYPIFLVTAARA